MKLKSIGILSFIFGILQFYYFLEILNVKLLSGIGKMYENLFSYLFVFAVLLISIIEILYGIIQFRKTDGIIKNGQYLLVINILLYPILILFTLLLRK